ncbi:MAG: malectin, partial [Fibrobacterales bacterium]
IYAYQTLAGADKLQTGGLILVPPLNSNSTKEVYISGIGKVGNPLYSFLTQGGAEVRVNGTLLSQSPTTVTGNSDWVTYTITDASIFGGKNADVHITSDKALNASAVFQDDNVGGGGYYSGFSEEESFVGVGTIGIKNYTLACNTPIALLGSGGVAYDWSSKNPTDWDMVEPVPNSGDSAYLFTPKSDMGEGPFAYTVIIDVETEDGIRKDTSDLTIRVIPIDMNFGGDQHVCKGEPTILNYSSRDYSAPVLEQEQVWAVNFGGVAHSGSDDIDYSASENFGYSRGGSVAVISGTNDPELYSNAELYADGDMTLTKKVDNGTYRLSLMFAETYYSNAGERLFNVEVEGTRFKTNLDLIEQVGKNSAYIIEENVIITDGELTIQLLNGTQGSPFINALKLTRDIIETDPHYTWLPASFLNHSNLMSPIATVYDDTEFEVTYDDGHCLIDNSVNVIVEDCGKCRLTAYGNKTICKGESTEISAEGRGDFVDWQYDRKGETKVLTNTTPTVTPDKTTTYLVRYNNAIKTSVTEDFDPAIFCETEVTITVDPCGEIVTPEGEVTKAEIYDVNGDGIAETIHVTFDRPLPQLPRNITSIDWPTEGVNDITADIEELQFLDSTTVMITLDNAFVPATEADVDNPPSLTYGNSSVLIEDKIGPIVIQAEKTTPATLQYAIKDDAGEYTYHLQPDTFKITLSEDIDFPSNGWKEMFSVVAVNGDTYTPAITTKPKSGTAINTLMVIFENTPNTAIPKIGNTLSFNTNNSVTDIYDNQSRQNFVEITGTALTKSSLGINFRNAVVGIDNTTDKNVATEEIPVYNEDNELLEETKYGTAVLSNQWVPPYNYTDGILDPNARCEDIQTEGNFDHRCFASLAIGTFKDQGIYTATIYIYSHLGQYITNWSQSFGECGEFTNSDRNDQTDIEQYFINDLIWNIKGLDGRKVASGVYFWKVVLTFTSGKKEEFTKNMGILRQDNSCE